MIVNDGGGAAYEGFQLEPKWPGLSVDEDVDVVRPQVKNVLKSLLAEMDELLEATTPGTPKHLEAYGKVAQGHLGDWDVPQGISPVFAQAHAAIVAGSRNLFIQGLSTVQTGLASIGNLDQAEEKSTIPRNTSNVDA
ncbi:hypothetical protein Sru01_33160 [Sphaerisporangium rufum]|uniref:Uncharacterized protein n=1 Tax=Sphaerisporangium rufum TaxID=1381558 RepID=A0A919R2D6_9ACTN|nr:hypothetical protein [Sphaerisporangium rufum]GII78334.1 hypothetical protein Sru01_33160 [Sphaerisporangium rufum]